MKNGRRGKRWRVWHKRRDVKSTISRAPLASINAITLRYLGGSSGWKLVDNLFTCGPFMMDEQCNDAQQEVLDGIYGDPRA